MSLGRLGRLSDSDQRLLARYVDGGLDAESRAALERRLLKEPALRAAAAEQQSVRSWFAGMRDEPQAPVHEGFGAAVSERVRRLPGRDELLADEEGEVVVTERMAQRLLVAAALFFGMSMLVWGGLLRSPDPPRLEAADVLRIEAIDAAIEAATAHHDVDWRRR